MPTVGKISPSLEDYIEVIYDLISEKEVARVSDIALKKSVRKASVNNALKRLAKEKLITHENYRSINLTKNGTKLAEKLAKRHKVIKTFLKDIIKIKPQIADADACAIEHYIHKETIDGLIKFITATKKKTKRRVGTNDTKR